MRTRKFGGQVAVRGFAIVAMLVALLAPARPALAEHETRDGMYEEEWYIGVQFLYQFQWESPWVADLDRVEVVEGEYDRVVVINEDTGAEIEVVGASGADPADVLAETVDSRETESGAEVIAEDEGTVDEVDFVSATVAYEGEDGPVEEYIESTRDVFAVEGAPVTDGAATFFVRAPEGDLEDTLAGIQELFLRDIGLFGPMLLGVEAAANQASDDDEDATATAEAEETAAAEDEDTGGDDEDDETATAEAEETAAAEDEDQDGGDDTGVDGDAYESPTFGYTLEWDEDLWTVDEERTLVDERDVLTLDYADGGFLFIEGYEAYDGDPADCLEGSANEILELDDVDDVAPFEDDAGDPVEGEDDGVAFAAYTLTFGGEEVVGYFDCRTLVEDEAVLAFSLIVLETASEDGIADLTDLQDTLELVDEGNSVSDDDATQTAEAEEGGNGGGDEDDETVTAEAEETATAEAEDSGTPGGDTGAYESDAGWAMEFDSEFWGPEEPTSEQTFEVRLNSTVSTADFTVFDDFDGDAEACVEDRGSGLEGGDFEDFEEIEAPSGDEGQASASYSLTLEGDDGPVDLVIYVECRTVVAGDTTLEILFLSNPDDFDDELDAFQDVLDSIETPDANAGGGVVVGLASRRQAA
ncbi:MAG: hypothetical protein WKF80_05590 [Thermomicrobiales bacterium]